MTLARILVSTDGGESAGAALAAGLLLARAHRARLETLFVQVDVAEAVPAIGEGMSGAAVEQVLRSMQEESAGRLKVARALFEKACADGELPVADADAPLEPDVFTVAFRHEHGREGERVLARARVSDLTVFARAGEDYDHELPPSLDSVLFASGRPVLVVPPRPVSVLGKVVAVAWNRSAEAARAVTAALPLLAAAETVVVLGANEARKDAEPSECAAFLAGHGIAAQTWAFTPSLDSIGESLSAEAKKAKADLLVMGAYGHSRLREMVLGGATRGILGRKDETLPVFLMH